MVTPAERRALGPKVPKHARRRRRAGPPVRRAAACGAQCATRQEQAGPAQHERRRPGQRRLERHGRRRRHPRDTGGDQGHHQRRVAWARTVGPGDGAGQLARPEGAHDGERRHRVPGRGHGPEQQPRDGDLVARGQREGVGQLAGTRQRAAGQPLGTDPAYDEGGRRPRRGPRRARPSSIRVGSAVPANPTNTARPIAPTNRSAPTLITASPRPRPVRVSRCSRHTSAPTWPGRDQAQQLRLGVRAHVPPPGRARRR